DQSTDQFLRLTAPDAVLLAGPDGEGQGGIAHRAGLTDGDGLSLEVLGVGEERVVVDRDDLEAGGLIAPAADLGHVARSRCMSSRMLVRPIPNPTTGPAQEVGAAPSVAPGFGGRYGTPAV